jgi:hypothetical protein
MTFIVKLLIVPRVSQRSINCSKSISEKHKDLVAIVGSNKKVWDLTTILGKQFVTNLLQEKRGRIGTLRLHISLK